MNLKEKIKAEIERRKDICSGVFERNSDTYYQGKAVAYDEALSFLGTLEDGASEKPNNPEGLDEAAEEAATEVYTYTFQGMDDLIGLFKAGAEWAFGQGVTFISPIDYDNDGYFLDSFEQQAAAINRLGVKVMDKVIVQIRKKED